MLGTGTGLWAGARPRSSAPVALATISGVWTWYNDPRAVVYDGKLLVGTVESDGDVAVYEGAAPYTAFTRTELKNEFEVDDHDNPALLVREGDGRILAAFAPHGAGSYWTALSDNPRDASSFGEAVNIDAALGDSGYSYADLYQLEGETDDPIYLFYRAGTTGAPRRYTTSTDGGQSWAAPATLVENPPERPYLKACKSSPTRLDFVISDGHPLAGLSSIYHFYYEGGSFRATDGTPLTLPINPTTDLVPVHDGTVDGRSWNWEVRPDSAGNPVILYTVFPGWQVHSYWRAVWDGAAWQKEELVADAGTSLYPGQAYYSGGMCLAAGVDDLVYAAIEDANEVYQVHRFMKVDGQWNIQKLTDEATDAFRPVVVPGIDRLLYVTGRYTSYVDYDTRIGVLDIAPGVPGEVTDWSAVNDFTGGRIEVTIGAYPVLNGLVPSAFEYSTDDGATWADLGIASPGTVTVTAASAGGALDQETDYPVRVRAVNALGAGGASAAVTVRPEGPDAPEVLAFDTQSDPSSQAAYTFPAIGSGTGTAIICVVSRNGVSGATATLDGVAATFIGEQVNNSNGMHWFVADIDGPADLVFNTGTTGARAMACVWTVPGNIQAADCSLTGTGAFQAPSRTVSPAVTANDLLLAAVFQVGNAVPPALTWAGVTSRLSNTEIEGSVFYAAADAPVPADDPSYDVTVDWGADVKNITLGALRVSVS